jgi:predicted RNA-binding protein with PUA-like domain
VGDTVLVYHSSCPEPGIAGVATVVRAGYPDSTAFDPDNEHYDPKSKRDDPRWFMVDIQLQRKFPRLLTLGELKSIAALAKMELCQQGSRLSIQRVTPGEFAAIEKLAKG